MMTPIRPSYGSQPPMATDYVHNPYMVVQNPNHNMRYASHSDATGGPSSTMIVPVMGGIQAVPPTTRRTRASKPKVRTGCITCKIRHVKCDETKPACKRCTSTGRKCDGYKPQEQSGGTTDVMRNPVPHYARSGRPAQVRLPTSMTHAFQGTVQERDAFQRFQEITIPALNGGSEAEFWNSLVLRAAIQEPVIRQAIIALGSLHEDYSNRGGRHDKDLIQQPTYQRAIQLYNKALRQLNDRLARTEEDTTKIVVIASILFTCFEVLRRNEMTAIVHYRAGMNLLMRHINKRKGAISQEPDTDVHGVFVKQIPQDELDVLLRVFARYDVQACTFAKPRAEPLSIEIPNLSSHSVTLKDVRYHLDNLLIASYQLITTDGGMYRYWPQANVPDDWRQHVEQQLGMFEKWQSSLETFFRASETKLSPSDAKSLLGLRLQIKVAIIRLKTSFNAGPESTFDAYRNEFEEMIASVERVTQSLALTDADPLDKESTPFTMELGIIHPLFFVASKCRDHRLRKRAIAQLRKAGKEGIWDGPIMAVLAKRMMQIEESGLINGQTVPERSRIHRVQKTLDYDGRRLMVEMTRAQDSNWEKWESIREAIPF